LLNRLGKDLLDLRRRFFEIGHRWSKRSTGKAHFDQPLVTFWVTGRQRQGVLQSLKVRR
jgi:hypothetical protein